MSVLVAVTDSPEGEHALHAAADEAVALGTELVAVNLKLGRLDISRLREDVVVTVVERSPSTTPADVVLTVLDERRPDVDRLVVGVRRRSPVGKAVLGSLSQRLILEAPVPVVAVKLPETSGRGVASSSTDDADDAGSGDGGEQEPAPHA